MNHHLSTHLKHLKLPAIPENLTLREWKARESNLGYIESLSLLIQDEAASGEANILPKPIQTGGLDPCIPFESFDFRFNNDALQSQTIKSPACKKLRMK